MKISAINEVVSLIANIGVIGSIVFLGLESKMAYSKKSRLSRKSTSRGGKRKTRYNKMRGGKRKTGSKKMRGGTKKHGG